MHRKLLIKFILILLLVLGCLLIDLPKGPDIHLHKWGIDWDKEIKLHLGLDLQGGTHLIYECDLSNIEPKEYDESVAGVKDVIERRVNQFGVTEPRVESARAGGTYRVSVELPGIKNIHEAIKMIGETPYLEFRETREVNLDELPSEAREELEDKEGPVAVFVPTKLTGKQLKRAQVQFNPETNEPEVGLEFNDEGKKLFGQITKKNIGKQVAIYLDQAIISAPVVKEEITSGKAVISGKFSLKEAKDLVMRLNSGALPVPIKLISEQSVGPTLGRTSVERSLIAGLIGIIIVGLFMILYYRFLGIISTLALFIYALIVLALFKTIPVTLTLAGVAGFILSIGMAVDANVLIFERLKEELKSGKPFSSALSDGFRRAWTSIRDSNISTIIICLILAWLGTSVVRGFAITLLLGVVVSMFTAITVTKTFLEITGRGKLSEKMWLFGARREKIKNSKLIIAL